MLTMVLKKNNFTFNGNHYLQINGTAMGTKMAPSYANIFMGKFEKQLLEWSIERPLSWYRSIDDMDMRWTQSDEELQNFLSRANNLHPSIKFTHEISNTTISFLDTSSSLSEGVLSTDVYSKSTDTNQYLFPSSCHPPHVTKSIPYSQALRIRRICSTDKSLKKRLGQLKNHLKRRGYKQSIIKKSFNKANNISRSSLLQNKEKRKCKRTPCVLTYHPCLRNSFNTIRGHWTSVEKKFKLSKVFPEPPMVAFKQPNSLRNLLVRAEMSKPNTTIGNSHSCGDKRCKCCKHMQHSSSYTSKVTGKQCKVFALLIARVQVLFKFLSFPFVASNTLASLSSPSTNA
jgi:peptide-methionine (R)-S-oxide reductase